MKPSWLGMRLTMKSLKIITGVIVLSFAGACASVSPDHAPADLNTQIDTYVEELVLLNEVPGLALAVIHKGNVIYADYHGVTALPHGENVSDRTVFRIYSLSKIMAAVAIFELIEQDKLDLSTPLSEFFDDLPNDWKAVTIGHLLAHASGLPDIRNLTDELANEGLSDTDFFNLVYVQDRQYQTGDDWSYTQTNYLLLERVLEHLTGETFEDYLRKRQFPQVDPARVMFSSSDFDDIPHRAKNYKYNVETDTHEQKLENYGSRNNILAGLNLTLDELVIWSQNFDADHFIRPATKQKMWTPFEFNQSEEQFLYGWGVYPVADQISYGFTGGGVSGLRKFPNHDLTIIVLTNGFKYYSVHNTVINHVAGMVDRALENNPVALARMYQHEFLKTKELNADALYNQTQEDRPDLDVQEVMTSFGYKLFDIRETERALQVFVIIAKRNPDSFSAFENLGHAYLSQGEMRNALINFKRALELDPDSMGTQKMVRGICERTENLEGC